MSMQLLMARARMNHKSSGGDVPWSKVKALLHFESDYTDEKGGLWTPHGSPSINTSSPLTGLGSLSLASGSYLKGPQIDLSGQIFCIEMQVKLDSNSGTDILLQNRTRGSGSSSRGMQLGFYSGAIEIDFWDSGGTYTSIATPATLDLASAKRVIAVTNDGTHVRIFVDGELITTGDSYAIGNSYPTFVGSDFNSSRYFDGLIDELRIVVDDPVHTTNYTPRLPFPDGG